MKKTLILLLFSCFTLLSNAQTFEWEQTNGPTGGGVYYLLVENDTLFAAADDGIYFSSDKGESWSLRAEQFRLKVRKIVRHKKVLFAYTDKKIYTSLDNGKTWEVKTTYKRHENVKELISTKDYLYYKNFSNILISTDAGDTWNKVEMQLSDVNRINAMPHELIQDGNDVYVYCYLHLNPYIYKIIPSTRSLILETLRPDLSNNYSNTTSIFKAEDTWLATVTTNAVIEGNIGFGTFGPQKGWIPNHKSSKKRYLYKSIKGQKWELIAEEKVDKIFNYFQILAFHTNTLYVVKAGKLYTSMDFGKTLVDMNNKFSSKVSNYYNSIQCLNIHNNSIYLGHSNGLYKTSKTDINWQDVSQNGITCTFISGLWLFDDVLFARVKDKGIYRSENMGDTWQFVRRLDTYDRGFFKKYDHQIFLFIDRFSETKIVVSEDNGISWKPFASAIEESKKDIFKTELGRFFVSTPDAIYYSDDGESNWSKAKIEISFDTHQVFSRGVVRKFIHSSYGLYAASSNKIYFSKDNGLNWNIVFEIENDKIKSSILNLYELDDIIYCSYYVSNSSEQGIRILKTQQGKTPFEHISNEIIPIGYGYERPKDIQTYNDQLFIVKNKDIYLYSDESWLKFTEGIPFESQPHRNHNAFNINRFVTDGTNHYIGTQASGVWRASTNQLENKQNPIFFDVDNLNNQIVYPNPFSDRITISLKEHQLPVNVTIYDISGRQLSQFILKETTTISTDDFKTRILIVELKNHNEIQTFKLIKQ